MTKQNIRDIRSRIFYYESEAYKRIFDGPTFNPLGARINLAKAASLRDYLQDETGEIHSSYTVEDLCKIEEILEQYKLGVINE